jgi:glycosyltransferase involved in cell wall biosynthesis
MSTQQGVRLHPDGPGRLIVDASTLVRWWGPPVGIIRVEAEIVRWALDQTPPVTLSVYDTRSRLFRPLDGAVARALVDGQAVVELGLMPDPRPIKRSPLRALFTRGEAALRPVLRLRRRLACALDRRRQALPPGMQQRIATSLVDLLLSRRARARVFDKDGHRRNLFWLDSVLGPPLHLDPNDTLLSAGSDWGSKEPSAIAALKQRTGFRLVAICYDLIPILFPHYYGARDVEVFTRFFRAAIGFTDRFICISKRTAADLADFARAHGRGGLDIRSERLGADAVKANGGAAVPSNLAGARTILYVSTIEPRKNHALLLRVWKRLAAGEQGGTAGYKLVLAGRRGWMVDGVMAALREDAVLARDVVHVANASDAVLHALYRHAAFCVYPSLYEGFGLPVVEAFMHGKPVIVSSAGSLPEAAAGLAPCLDPNDEDAWVAAIGRWINDPAELSDQTERIRKEFSWPTWREATARIVAMAREP